MLQLQCHDSTSTVVLLEFVCTMCKVQRMLYSAIVDTFLLCLITWVLYYIFYVDGKEKSTISFYNCGIGSISYSFCETCMTNACLDIHGVIYDKSVGVCEKGDGPPSLLMSMVGASVESCVNDFEQVLC